MQGTDKYKLVLDPFFLSKWIENTNLISNTMFKTCILVFFWMKDIIWKGVKRTQRSN